MCQPKSRFANRAYSRSPQSMSWPSGVWESDEELDEFLADLYASRRANIT